MIQLVNRDLHSAVDGRRAVAGTRTRFGSPGIRKSIGQQVPPSSRPGLGLAADRGQLRDSRPILSRGFYAACRCSRALRRAMIASTSLVYLVPHSHRGASDLPKVLPKAVREYSTLGGISP